MKDVPKWLEGRQENGAEIFGLVQPKTRATGLDLVYADEAPIAA